MASQSKYSNAQLDALLNDLIITLEQHKASVDLSLMALGNLASNLIQNNVHSAQQREVVANAFADALKNALKSVH